MTHYRHDAWQNLTGALVEVRKDGTVVREGLVDDVMPDSSALWIAANGFANRTLVEAAEGYEVWVEPKQLEGKRAYRMTSSALHPGAAGQGHTALRPRPEQKQQLSRTSHKRRISKTV